MADRTGGLVVSPSTAEPGARRVTTGDRDAVPSAGMDHGDGSGQEGLDLSRPDAYGRSFADVYDRWYTGVSDAEATARFVDDRSPTGPILEIGVGSGRLAAPLVTLGRTVVGIDGSRDMLTLALASASQAAGRCGTDRPTVSGGLHLVQADMRSMPVAGRFGAVLIAFNTFFNLSTAREQRSMLDDIASLLGPDGVLIIEALDVTPLLVGPEDSIGVREAGPHGLVVTATQLDRSLQVLTGQHLEITDDGICVRPWRLRWLTPNQLDDLCHSAGLALDARYGDWNRNPLDGEGQTHISVYRRR